MGSYNRVCAISNTPIMNNQKARVFFLVLNVFDIYYNKDTKNLFKTSFSESHCYPHENFQIIGYPLLATYTDKCFYEFEDKEMSDLVLHVLNESYFPNRIGEDKSLSDYNSSHDFLNIESLDNMDTVQNMIKSGSLRVSTPHGISSVVEMAIHEDIYQDIILRDGWDSGHYFDKKENFNDSVQAIMNKYIHNDNIILSEEDKTLFDITTKILLKDSSKTLEEVTSDYIERIKMTGSYDVSHAMIDRHQTLTNYKKDIQHFTFPQKIIEAYLGGLWTNNWFYKNNFEFHSPMTSNADQDHDYSKHLKRFSDISRVVSGLKKPYDDEEYLEIKETVVYTLTKDELESKVTSWYDQDSDACLSMKKNIDHILSNNIRSFVVGDESLFDQFIGDYDLLNSAANGELILLDFY